MGRLKDKDLKKNLQKQNEQKLISNHGLQILSSE